MMETTLAEQFGPIESMNLIMQSPSTVDTKTTSANNHHHDDNNASHHTTTPSASGLNAGVAYVTFVAPDAAQQCVHELKMLDQRPVTVMLLSNSSSNQNSSTSGGGGGGSSSAAANRRYWSEIDLSIQCYTCGQTGHRSYECPGIRSNKKIASMTAPTLPLVTPRTNVSLDGKKPRRPCPLCANRTDHTEIFRCPYRNVCFNCGIPGHISRECTQSRRPYQHNGNHNNNNNNVTNIINRCVCTICYSMNHHTKYNCPWTTRNTTSQRNNNNNNNKNHRNPTPTSLPPPPQVHPAISTVSSHAICASCGRTGHFLCHELKWFYGLLGVSCSNW